MNAPFIPPTVLASIVPGAAASEPFNPAARGLHAVYRAGETNHCPGCGRTHWHIGRATAECAFCATAIPLETTFAGQSGTIVHRKGR